MNTPLDPASWQAAGSASLILVGLAAAVVGLPLGIAIGWGLRGRKNSPEIQTDDQLLPDDPQAANALTDVLTSLASRRAFDAELFCRIAEFQRQATPCCLLMLDVDHFKSFNDIHDHLAGDDVLRMVCRTLKATVRTADFVARYGGEEFGIVMPQTTLAEALESAQRVRAGIEQTMCEFGGRKLNVTVSIGVAEIEAGQSPSAFIACANEALYAAKQAGRNQVQPYRSPTMVPPAATTATGRESSPPLSAPAETKLTHHRTAPSRSELPAIDTRTDSQTGLPNRTAFCEEIRRRLSEAQRHGNRLSLMLIRIDNLSKLIQQLDPQDVILVLRTCGQFLTAALRDMDLVVRYEADVFGIVLPGTALVNATGVGHRLRKTIQQCPLRLRDDEIHFTMSVGVAESQPGEDLMSFINRAEEAKTVSAAGGGNKVRFHTGISVEAQPEKVEAVA